MPPWLRAQASTRAALKSELQPIAVTSGAASSSSRGDDAGGLAEMVGEDDLAARLQHAGELGQRRLRVSAPG